MPQFRVRHVLNTHGDLDRVWVEPVDRPAHQGPVHGDINFWVDNGYLAKDDIVSIDRVEEAEEPEEVEELVAESSSSPF